MSKYPPKRIFPQEKNVFTTPTIPDNFKDKIRGIVNSGEYGKLTELLINYPVNLSFSENKLTTSLLHNVIQSTLTNTEKINLIELLIKRGVSVNNLDDNGLSPLYYAIQKQSPEIVKLLLEKNYNVNKLPKNYDYFRLALEPSIQKCKVELFNPQDQASMSKYYSQQISIEREFRKIMNTRPITTNILKYILEFVNTLPEQTLSYIDLEDLYNPVVKNSLNIRLEGDDEFDKLPPFENKIADTLNNITKEILTSLNQGTINSDQLITKKIDLTKSLRVQLNTFLNTNTIKDIIKVNQITLNNIDNSDNSYKRLFDLGSYDFDNLFLNLIQEYYRNNGVYDQIKSDIDKYQEELNRLLNKLGRIATRNTPIATPPYQQLIYNNNTFRGGASVQVFFDYLFNLYKVDLDQQKFYIPNILTLNSKIEFINKFKKTIFLSISLYYYIEQQFSAYFNTLNEADKNTYQNVYDTIKQAMSEIDENIKRFNNFIVKLNNISESLLLYNQFIPKDPKNLLFNNHFLLYYITDLDNAKLNFLSFYSNDAIFIYSNPVPAPLQNILFSITPKYNAIPVLPSRRKKNFVSHPNTLIYDPTNIKINNLPVISLIYHRRIFNYMLTVSNPPNIYSNQYLEIRRKFITDNPLIKIDIIDELLIKILHQAIINNFDEMIQLCLFVKSTDLVNNRLLENNINNNPNIKSILRNILRNKESIKTISRKNKDQSFYLDENYTSSDPIDVILCTNNNVDIIKLLKKKMSINVKEYQDLIIKLGDKNIFNELNETTRSKITQLDVTRYLNDHQEKFKKAVQYLSLKLSDEIKLKELGFFTEGKNISIAYYDLELDNTKPILIDRLNYDYKDIYNDLVNTQEKSNLFLTIKLRDKLNKLFEEIIIPEITEFLQFFSNDALNNIITYNNLKDSLQPLIDDIIFYHLNVDPSKAKIQQISLDDTLSKFSELFINFLDEKTRINIQSIYNEKLKNKVSEITSLTSAYYLNVYRNYLKYIFNDTRYKLQI